MDQNSGILYIVKLILSKKKSFVLISIGALAIGIALAFIIPVYYKSTAIFYPYSPKTYDPRFLFSDIDPGDIELFGNGDDADRAVTIGNSSLIANFIIEKYKLTEHYGINRNDKYYVLNTIEEFKKNYRIGEDDRSAIAVTILDKDADTAALMANDIVAQIDFYNRKPLIESNALQLETYRANLNKKYSTLDSLSKKATENQPKTSDNERNMTSIELIKTYSNMKEAETRLSILKQDFKTLYIIEKAVPILKKAKPVRWMVVTGTVFGTLVLYLVGLILMDQYKKNIATEL